LELNRHGECPLEPVNNLKTDPRYFRDVESKKFELFDWGVKSENGVGNILMGLPSYAKEAGSEPWSDKTKVALNWRNTIPWSLDCENKGFNRQVGYDQFSITLKRSNSPNYETLYTLSTTAYALLGFWQLGSCCCGNCANLISRGEGWFFGAILQGCQRISVVILASIMLGNLRLVNQVTSENIETLQNYEFVDCSDD